MRSNLQSGLLKDLDERCIFFHLSACRQHPCNWDTPGINIRVDHQRGEHQVVVGADIKGPVDEDMGIV